jgi:EAL domain-containing protein (putative c-di-GMP-specific phosphodiesterase class I)
MPFVERMPRRVAMVTEVILDEATASCRRWRDEGRPFGVWVRLPAVLRQPDLVERALRILRSYRLPPDALTFQLSLESTRVPGPSPEESAASLRAAEIRVAFDHGASPRAVVSHAAPLCEVGVSVSQAQDDAGPGGAASHWAGIVSDARRRGYATVCRGISSREAWAAAEAAGCDLAQGAFIARAVPGPEFARWMRRWMPSTRP